jgi:hypothetical protein
MCPNHLNCANSIICLRGIIPNHILIVSILILSLLIWYCFDIVHSAQQINFLVLKKPTTCTCKACKIHTCDFPVRYIHVIFPPTCISSWLP